MNDKTIARFNELLRSELSAVETYNLALKQAKHADFTTALQKLRDAHDQRVTGLREKIRALGGEAAAGSGAWGAWAKVVQAGADLLGDTTAVAALEEGEDHGVKLYAGAVGDEDPLVRDYVATTLMPKQQESHNLCRSLKRFVKSKG
jgi:hypothetical protein